MPYEFDAKQGRGVGSVIRISERFPGLSLVVVEVMTERMPPFRKTWKTRGPQRLLILESYAIGFETRAVNGQTNAQVYIDYQLPCALPGRWLGLLFAGFYARLCVFCMLDDARSHFLAGAEPLAMA